VFAHKEGVMKWRFSCYVCGMTYELQHRQTHRDAFYEPGKTGRPTLSCPECDAQVVGDMIGGRK